LLAVLLVAAAVSGLLTLRAGTPEATWVYVLHGLGAGVLAGAIALKLRRSVPGAVRHRRLRRLLFAATLSVAAIAALVGGYAWVASGSMPSVGRMTLLTLHAIVGLALAPFVVVHLLPRRWRLLWPGAPGASHRGGSSGAGRRSMDGGTGLELRARLLSRRTLVTTTVLGTLSVALWLGANALERLLGTARRFTGSRWLPRGGIPPTTTFFGESAPPIDPTAWRLRVTGLVDRPTSYTLDQVRSLGERDVSAVLDCTGGWVHETDWRGVPTARIIDAAGPSPSARKVEIRSITGWTARFTLDDVRRTFLATGVAGSDLPHANGAPVRLVVPERRGLDWVKWVEEIRLG
jgi:DMSO/TMAO reductase YedYZ molybdopterin-dependent catalytic subunit